MKTNLLTRAWRPFAAGAGVLTVAAALTLTTGGIANAATGPTCVDGTCTVSFALTGAPETWIVPTGVTSITATVKGGAGGAQSAGARDPEPTAGGAGGDVQATLPVASGDAITAVVGSKGADGVANSATPAAGGYGGGGNGGSMAYPTHSSGGAGGGGSFLFTGSALAVAAGGGGGSSAVLFNPVTGGTGGTTGAGTPANGQAGLDGGQGTATGPGAAGNEEFAGAPGSSAMTTSPTAISAGGAGAINTGGSNFYTAGGGGGGLYGGGGGGTDGPGGFSGAGGGGSGFVATAATNVTTLAGNTGDGSIVLTYAAPAVVKTATATTVTASANPVVGEPTTLTATVTPAPADGGLVTFKDGTTTLGTAPVTDGVATLKANLAEGAHSITAAYAGDTASADSTSTAKTVTVAPAAPATTKPVFPATSSKADPIVKTATAGKAFSFTGLAATGTPAPTYTVKGDDQDGQILPDGVTFENGVLAGRTTTSGIWLIEVTATNSAGTTVEHIALEVGAAAAVGLNTVVVPGDGTTEITRAWTVAPDGTVTEATETGTVKNAIITAKQGEQVSFISVPVDRYGNIAGDVKVKPATKSSVASDTITYDADLATTSVLFNHASPHTITVALDGVTTSFTVQVAAVTTPTAVVPTSLAFTGSNPSGAAGLAGLLLAAGIALRGIVIARRRRA
ncbi:Ig-like domain-containing protein [Frondihabitans sp. PhB188]|uniref:Ig-like domain-containing protein n=1 Tax=Frondihabitans sp. PhB188 TaxID=2485200 RepID=UPI00131562BA|nr:Ig-like domain-containing protein [Frondihabitans sp. PhB188]